MSDYKPRFMAREGFVIDPEGKPYLKTPAYKEITDWINRALDAEQAQRETAERLVNAQAAASDLFSNKARLASAMRVVRAVQDWYQGKSSDNGLSMALLIWEVENGERKPEDPEDRRQS